MFTDYWYGNGKGVLGKSAGELRGILIEIEQERSGRGKISIGIEYAESDGVRLTVIKSRGERRQVDPIGFEVEGLNARNGDPKVRIDATGVDPRIDGGDARGTAIDRDFGFAESGARTALKLVGNIVGDAGVPEFVVGLALGEDIHKYGADVGRQSEGFGEKIGAGVKADGAAGRAGGESDDLIGSGWCGSLRGHRIEEQRGRALEHSGIDVIHSVAEVDGAVLSNGKDRAVVGEVTLNLPVAGKSGLRLGCGTEINVGGSDPDIRGAIVLDSGADGEICFENHGSPRSGAVGGRGVSERLRIEIRELDSFIEFDDAGLGAGMRHGRIGEGGVHGSNFELGGGDG